MTEATEDFSATEALRKLKSPVSMDSIDEFGDLTEIENMYSEISKNKEVSTQEHLKEVLQTAAKDLKDLEKQKKTLVESIEIEVKGLNKQIAGTLSYIRKVWGPFLEGVDEAKLELDGVKLEFKQNLNAMVVDKDAAITWLENNNHKDVLKWDINTNSLKSLAKKKYEDEDVSIDGLEYNRFPTIKAK